MIVATVTTARRRATARADAARGDRAHARAFGVRRVHTCRVADGA
ncbi:MAG TPA: hypothetical protein VK989_10775 [Polyangia bacterium]|nr:hypothetical protein [Polyangia bacterium]